MCKSNSMLILNGRCGDDKFTGPMTFRNQSVIDYSILSFQSLQFIKSFRALDMCKSNSMLILNGRCGDDKFTGPMTFRNQSVIDYSIVSFQSLQFIKSFRALENDALFSDGHSLISTSLCFKNDLKVKKSVPINTNGRKPRLPEEKRTNFIENLNRIKIQSLLANITQTSQTTDSLSKEK